MKNTSRIVAALGTVIIGSAVLPARSALADDAWVDNQGVTARNQDRNQNVRLSDAWVIEPAPTEQQTDAAPATDPAAGETTTADATPTPQD